jgi:hypothetical protein
MFQSRRALIVLLTLHPAHVEKDKRPAEPGTQHRHPYILASTPLTSLSINCLDFGRLTLGLPAGRHECLCEGG